MVKLQIFIDILHSKSDELFSSNIVNGLYVYVVYDKGTCTNFFDYSVFELLQLYTYVCYLFQTISYKLRITFNNRIK